MKILKAYIFVNMEDFGKKGLIHDHYYRGGSELQRGV